MGSSSRSRRIALAAAATLLVVAPRPIPGQEFRILGSQIAVSGRDATLQLEFQGGRSLEIAFREGEVRINGSLVGRYTPGDPLERSWRELLGRTVSLDPGALGRTLRDWTPPPELDGQLAMLAARIDRALQDALGAAAAAGAPPAPSAPSAAQGRGLLVEGGEALRRMLTEAARRPGMAEAVDDLELDRVRLYSDENVVIPSDEVVESGVVVVDGDLDVRGTIRGSVLLVDGEVRVYEGARIEGDVRLVDASLERLGGEILGSVRHIESEIERNVRQADVERMVQRAIRGRTERSQLLGPLRHIARGLAGIFQTLAVFAVLAVIGAALVFFARDKLEVVADTARSATGRAAGVGLAGLFLLLPAFVLGIIVLAVSIIGIPLLLVWVPLFPGAAFAAAVLGYLGVAHAIGEFVASHRFNGWDWLRRSNSYSFVFTGLAVLLAAFLAAHAVQIGGPWFGLLHALLVVLGVFATTAAVVVGFGSVLLSRAGTSRAFVTGVPPDLSGPEPERTDVEGADA